MRLKYLPGWKMMKELIRRKNEVTMENICRERLYKKKAPFFRTLEKVKQQIRGKVKWRIAMITKYLKEPTYIFTIYFCWCDVIGMEYCSEPVCHWSKCETLCGILFVSFSNWCSTEVFENVSSFKMGNKCRNPCCLILFNACRCLPPLCHVNKIITNGKLYQ